MQSATNFYHLIFHFFILESSHKNVLYKIQCQFSSHFFADCFKAFQNSQLKSNFIKLINLLQQRSKASSGILQNFWISLSIWKKNVIPVRFIFLDKLRKQDSMIYFQGITWWLEHFIIVYPLMICLSFIFLFFSSLAMNECTGVTNQQAEMINST